MKFFPYINFLRLSFTLAILLPVPSSPDSCSPVLSPHPQQVLGNPALMAYGTSSRYAAGYYKMF